MQVLTPMWTYEQATGRLLHGAEHVATGYAGSGTGKNNPDMQDTPNVGPLPRGTYVINLTPFNTGAHGPFVLRLEPDRENQMFGRAGFLIHGDSVKAPGTASQGCIILPRPIRERIAASGDAVLEVVR